jgi:hypothetical protein
MYGDLGQFWLSCLDPLIVLLQKTLNYLFFQYFDYERTR